MIYALLSPTQAFIPFSLINEIHTKPMQDQAAQHEIRKRPFTANATGVLLNTLARLQHALRLLARIWWWAFTRLHPQAGCENELPDGGAEAG
jgi:hypothetical protein